ncbi:hypothetical protein AB0H42_10705 [Nocardia sp. NPDC050799]|uniref:hypothetical protein n=1 Tax=Nocardia sp. NPDC050799 TaxID=3154842 RepID=UPI0033E50117
MLGQAVVDVVSQPVCPDAETERRLTTENGQDSVVALPFLPAAEYFEFVGAAPAPVAVTAGKEWEPPFCGVETGAAPGAGTATGIQLRSWSMAPREDRKVKEAAAAKATGEET